ncbi:MAG: DNA mismatch repair endonuclease MutL [Rhodothermales bacterium]
MPETLANKIAAGEVVQRPASAAKELIENAIDAGADEVTLVLKAAGSELIQVIDNGCGMSPEDAVQSFRRHATSKIRSIEDLERIQTLGFRGEALASISAVAQVEMKTKRVQDDAGFRVRIDGGKVETTEPCATPDGTSIAVRNLFYNVPARRNFLKTPATEFKHLVETFQHLALANPSVAFILFHDDNEVYRLPKACSDDPTEALRQRISALLGKEYAENVIPVEETTSYLSASGFVSKPEFNRRSRGEQFLFVNGRYVKNRSLDHAVLHAFDGLLPAGSFPFYTLFLRLEARHVDVNVHPTKAEIKFDDERGVYGFVKAVVRKALGTADLTPQVDGGLLDQSIPERPSFQASAGRPRSFTPLSEDDVSGRGRAFGQGDAAPSFRPITEHDAPATLRQTPGELSEQFYRPEPTEQAERTIASGAMEEEAKVQPERAEGEPLLWQLHNRYILTQIRSGLMILDQHAAHERILYERALQSMKSGFGMSQQLLFPYTIDFGPADFELLKELMPDLRSLGFDLEPFGGRSVVVRGVPTDIRPGDERRILDDILQQYKNYSTELQIKGRENLAKSIAHRSAVRSGAPMSTKEMRTLIDQLFMCEMPYASPHGRPTIIKISIEELDKRFARGDG